MKRLVIVTGSSQGIGAAIATAFSEAFPSDTHIVLMARSAYKMNQVKQEILSKQPTNQVTPIQVDFGVAKDINQYLTILKQIATSDEELRGYEELYAIYNHGTFETGTTTEMAQGDLRGAFEVNLLSAWSLLAAINLWASVETITKQFHVNISSKYAIKPDAGASGQCAIRASREMIFKCLALDQPSLKVLNYYPGPVLTDILRKAAEKKEEYQDMIARKAYSLPEDNARKLVKLLLEDKATSGSAISYKD